VKLLQTVRADPSDTFVFEKAAEPGEWAVSGAFVFTHLDPSTLTGKARAAFRGGFLGLHSCGWSTLARIVEASAEDRRAAVEQLATQLVSHFSAPDLATARLAAEEEVSFATSLCNHPTGMLVAVSRRFETEATRETFRTLRPRPKDLPAFTFFEVVGDDEPVERIDLLAPINGGPG
jgi:uncharacterized protein DUF6505